MTALEIHNAVNQMTPWERHNTISKMTAREKTYLIIDLLHSMKDVTSDVMIYDGHIISLKVEQL
ncbi:MAG: hypothetical protein LUD81_05385 [Clostridiales bacterium]|nr:hypothetical protein [Clostridiales bacterium]